MAEIPASTFKKRGNYYLYIMEEEKSEESIMRVTNAVRPYFDFLLETGQPSRCKNGYRCSKLRNNHELQKLTRITHLEFSEIRVIRSG